MQTRYSTGQQWYCGSHGRSYPQLGAYRPLSRNRAAGRLLAHSRVAGRPLARNRTLKRTIACKRAPSHPIACYQAPLCPIGVNGRLYRVMVITALQRIQRQKGKLFFLPLWGGAVGPSWGFEFPPPGLVPIWEEWCASLRWFSAFFYYITSCILLYMFVLLYISLC